MENSASLRTRPAQAAPGRTPHSRSRWPSLSTRRPVCSGRLQSAKTRPRVLPTGSRRREPIRRAGAQVGGSWLTAPRGQGGRLCVWSAEPPCRIRSRRLIRTPGAFPRQQLLRVDREDPVTAGACRRAGARRGGATGHTRGARHRLLRLRQGRPDGQRARARLARYDACGAAGPDRAGRHPGARPSHTGCRTSRPTHPRPCSW